MNWFFFFLFFFLKYFLEYLGEKVMERLMKEREGRIRNEWSMVVIMYGEVSVDRFAKVKDD